MAAWCPDTSLSFTVTTLSPSRPTVTCSTQTHALSMTDFDNIVNTKGKLTSQDTRNMSSGHVWA